LRRLRWLNHLDNAVAVEVRDLSAGRLALALVVVIIGVDSGALGSQSSLE
jgi:hypothetical protein